jgi:hypothetical protein
MLRTNFRLTGCGLDAVDHTAGMPRGATVDGKAPAVGVLWHMRCDTEPPPSAITPRSCGQFQTGHPRQVMIQDQAHQVSLIRIQELGTGSKCLDRAPDGFQQQPQRTSYRESSLTIATLRRSISVIVNP